jgi:amidohydrolase
MSALFQWVDARTAEIEETYKQLHMQPELGFQEVKTAAFLASKLKKLGFEVTENIGKTGVLGVLKGKEPGKTFAVRADMDALPMQEATGLPYASKVPNVMHACGHDSHCTMLLYAVKALMANGGVKRGTLKVVFQPAEEILGGARAFIASGLLADVDEIVGLHVRNNTECKVGEACPAICHASSWRIRAVVKGKAAHGAWPHLGVNALDALAAIIGNVNAIHADPRVPHSVKCTRCTAGTGATNIIPDTAEMSIDVRSQQNPVMKELLAKTKVAVETGAAGVGAVAEMVDEGGVPAAELDFDGLVKDAAKSIEKVCGSVVPPVYTPGGEDFHCFAAEAGIKSAFIGIGADMATGGHTTTMKLDLRALPVGVKIMADLAMSKVG